MSYFLPCTDLESLKLLESFGARNNRFGNHWHFESDLKVDNEVLKTSRNFTDMTIMHKPCSFSIFQVMDRYLWYNMRIRFWDSSFHTWGSFVTGPISLTSTKQTSKFQSQKNNHTSHLFAIMSLTLPQSPWSNHPRESWAHCPGAPFTVGW